MIKLLSAVVLLGALVVSSAANATSFTFKCYLDRNTDGISWKFSKTVVVVADTEGQGQTRAFDDCYDSYTANPKPPRATITKSIVISH